jgi:hypothetical protein
MKLKCINDKHSDGRLHINSIYTSSQQNNYDECLIKENGCWWLRSRFVEIKEEIEVNKVNISNQTIDLSEEKLRKLLMPSRSLHECACGIARVQCIYHKDTY